MTTTYLLACKCGNKLPVDAGQSGLEVRCTCGAELTVPTMRGLGQLERAQASSEARAAAEPAGEWGLRQALIFLGLAIVALCVPPGIFLWYTYPQQPPVPEEFTQSYRDQLQTLTIEQVWHTFHQLKEGLNDEDQPPVMTEYLAEARQYGYWVTLLSVVAVTGLALALVGALVPSRRAARKS